MGQSLGGTRAWRARTAEGDRRPKSGGNAGKVKVGAALAVTAVSMGALGVWATTAGAAVAPLPEFPNNIVVFPDRDFVSFEGYEEYIGQTGLVEVIRPGVGVVGSAEAVAEPGGVPFEINHPGGACWGAGTGLNVTPDIQAGDEVALSFGGERINAVTVLAPTVTKDAYIDLVADPLGTVMKVEGTIPAGYDMANFEQRIIEPALRDTEVARRDIRALFGPLTLDPRGAYESGVELTSATTWVATYVFQSASTADIAANAGLGERAMSWQVTDAAANRQGLTISEFGEPGGPGMGGCPPGPLQSGPPAPTNIIATVINGGGAVQIDWTAAVAIPGTEAILGYEVTAVGPAASNGERETFGRWISDPASTGTILTGFGNNGIPAVDQFDIEIVSVSSVGKTFPAAHAIPAVDSTPPAVTASVPEGSYAGTQLVTLTADDPNAQIYFTTDGSSPIDTSQGPGSLSGSAEAYLGPITIDSTTTLQFVAFDQFDNVSDVTTLEYVITNALPAGTPIVTSITPGINNIDIAWDAADPVEVGAAIAGYEVRVYGAEGATNPLTTVEVDGATLNASVTGLLSETQYWVAVAAKNTVNPAFGAESERGTATTLGVTANAGVDQNVLRNTTVALAGSGSVGATYQWTQVGDALGATLPNSVDLVTLANATTLNPSFTLPNYDPYTAPYPAGATPKTAGPLYFKLTVTKGAVSASDVVKITPQTDTITVATARWKANDFRITGTGAIDGATITVRDLNGRPITSGVVTLGAWDIRIRTGVANPGAIIVTSNRGALVGPVPTTR